MTEIEQPYPVDDRELRSNTEGEATFLSDDALAPAQSLEQELDEISAAIDEAWDLLEPSFRYLADR